MKRLLILFLSLMIVFGAPLQTVVAQPAHPHHHHKKRKRGKLPPRPPRPPRPQLPPHAVNFSLFVNNESQLS